MLKHLFFTVVALVWLANACAGQSNSASSLVTNWGAPVYKIQLSITVTNHVMVGNSTIEIFAHIKNVELAQPPLQVVPHLFVGIEFW
jgi:hypothetical protein